MIAIDFQNIDPHKHRGMARLQMEKESKWAPTKAMEDFIYASYLSQDKDPTVFYFQYLYGWTQPVVWMIIIGIVG